MNWQDPQILIAQVVAISALGGLGSVVRLLLSRWAGVIPWGTLVGNAFATIVVGFALYLSLVGAGHQSSDFTVALIATGFAGGLSTFSSWAAQTVNLWRQQMGRRAFWYFFATTTACGIALILGLALGSLLLK
ncbi:MAG: FluC/FEX family fluoride channel [Micrococcales bacterium]